MNLDLSEDQAAALIKALHDIIESDRYPLSPRIQKLRAILAKLRPEPVCEPLPPPKVYAPPRATASRSGEVSVVSTQRSRAAVRRQFVEAERQRSAEWQRAVQATRRRREGAWLAFQSPHQRRATEILANFDVEVKKVTASPLATFILHYACSRR
jgi:hypothetical protein